MTSFRSEEIALMPVYGPNENGVSYDITPGTLNRSTVVIQNPDGSTQNLGLIPNGRIATTDGTSITIAAVAGSPVYVVAPTVDANLSVLANLLSNVTVHVGGDATFDTLLTGLSNLTFDVDGGSLTLASGIVANALSGTTVNLDNGGTFGNGSGLISALSGTTINFGSGGGTFVADAGGNVLNLSTTTLAGFDATTDELRFDNLPAGTSIDNYTIAGATGATQTVTAFDNGVPVLTFTLAAGTFPPGGFTAGAGPLGISADGSSIVIAACFMAGTLVATPAGPVAVEALRKGDKVLTAAGEVRTVTWLAVQTIARRSRAQDPSKIVPIRIAAGALGDNLPERDLYVSPDHGLLLDGCLVQAGALVNGTTVTRHYTVAQTFAYYHVELDDHSLVVVEGVAAETFIDHVSRRLFDNWHEAPEAPISELEVPRIKAWRQLPASLRERLEARADALGFGARAA